MLDAGELTELGEASHESDERAELLREGGESDGVLEGMREMDREMDGWREFWPLAVR